MPNPRELSQFGSFVEVDDTTKNIGIATTGTPYVGIGTLVPQEKLHVVGNFRVDGSFNATSSSIGVAVTTGTITRNINDKLSDYITVKDFGAVGDGVTDDTVSIFNAIQTGKELIFPPGTYKTTSNLVFSQHVKMHWGSKITTTASLTFNGGFESPLYHCLETIGSGFLAFSNKSTSVGYPEWFGAVVNDVSYASINAIAINGCLDVFEETHLDQNIYYVDDTIKIEKTGRKLIGKSGYAPESNANHLTPGRSSVICSTSSWKDVVRIGKNNLGAFATGITVKNILSTRNTPVTPPNAGTQFNIGSPSSAGSGASASFRIEYAAYSVIENCVGADSSIGFAYYSILGVTIRKCIASRSLNGTTSVNDIFYGHLINNPNSVASPPGIFLINSCHWEYCGSVIFGVGGLSTKVGFYMRGQFTDTILFKCEANLHDIGFYIEGTGAPEPSIDGFIIGCTADQPFQYGYRILNLTQNSVVTLQNNYSALGPSIPNATAHYSVEGCYTSQVKLLGNQGTGDLLSNGTCIGFQGINSGTITCKGNSWASLRYPIVLTTVTNSIFSDDITDFPFGTPLSRDYAFNASNSQRLKIDCSIAGNSGSFLGGINLTGVSQNNEINGTRINPSCISGNLITIDGNAVSTPGYKYSNMISGLLDGQGGDFTTTRVAIHRRPPTGRWSFGQNITKIDVNSDDTFNVTTRVGIVTVSIGDAALPPLTVK